MSYGDLGSHGALGAAGQAQTQAIQANRATSIPTRSIESAVKEIAGQMEGIWKTLDRLEATAARIGGGMVKPSATTDTPPSPAPHLHSRLCAMASFAERINTRLNDTITQIESFV